MAKKKQLNPIIKLILGGALLFFLYDLLYKSERGENEGSVSQQTESPPAVGEEKVESELVEEGQGKEQQQQQEEGLPEEVPPEDQQPQQVFEKEVADPPTMPPPIEDQQELLGEAPSPEISGEQEQKKSDDEEERTSEVSEETSQKTSSRQANIVKVLDSLVLDESLTYPAPENYLRKGRGLVYNCQERHWACVEKESYFQCAKNEKSSFQKGQRPNCVIKGIFSLDRYCIQGATESCSRGKTSP